MNDRMTAWPHHGRGTRHAGGAVDVDGAGLPALRDEAAAGPDGGSQARERSPMDNLNMNENEFLNTIVCI